MRSSRGAVFLDRDGVINACPQNRFITCWRDFRFLPGSLKALRLLHLRRRRVVVVSNQSAIGRGLLTREKLQEITQRMLESIRRKGGKVHAVYYCIHHPQAGCPCRKPRPGMLKSAARKLSINLSRSYVVGDHAMDIQMGQEAGCRTILVLSGRLTRGSAGRLKLTPDRIAKDLSEAVEWILDQ